MFFKIVILFMIFIVTYAVYKHIEASLLNPLGLQTYYVLEMNCNSGPFQTDLDVKILEITLFFLFLQLSKIISCS